MGTKNNPGNFDCYNNAEPDEPMFILLARDKHAPALVWLWAVLRELDGEKPEKVEDARKCMLSMWEWRTSRGKQSVGVGQSVLAGVLELIRASNAAMRIIHNNNGDKLPNQPTMLDFVRMLLAQCDFQPADVVSEGDAVSEEPHA